MMTQTVPKSRASKQQWKIRHFRIRKKNFKESGQISKDIIENQNMLVIIVEDLDIL